MLDALESRFLRALRSEVEEEIKQKQSTIVTGSLGSFEAYKERCGEIRGMASVLTIADDIERRINGNKER